MRFKKKLAALAALSVLAVAVSSADARPAHRRPYRVCNTRHHGFLGHRKTVVCHWVR